MPLRDAAAMKPGRDHGHAMRNAQRLQAGREELVERIAQAVHADGVVEALPGVRLRRASAPTELGHGASTPSC